MKSRFLLPHAMKRLGLILFLPCLAIGTMAFYFDFQIDGFEVTIPYAKSYLGSGPLENNLTDELASTLMLMCLFMIAFSEEKIEDEWVASVRLESLQWAVYLNYGLLAFAILFLYTDHFLQALIYNMYTILGFFIIRFNYVIRFRFNPSRIEQHEK